MAREVLQPDGKVRKILLRKRRWDVPVSDQIVSQEVDSKMPLAADVENEFSAPSPKRPKISHNAEKADGEIFPIFKGSSPKTSPAQPKTTPDAIGAVSPQTPRRTLSSPLKPKSQRKNTQGSLSPASPSKKLAATLRQGANQTNKIFRYLKPSSCNEETSAILSATTSVSAVSRNIALLFDKDKENRPSPSLLGVSPITPGYDTDHSETPSEKDSLKDAYCTLDKETCCVGESGKCQSYVSEDAVRVLDAIILAYADNPAGRLGLAQPLCATSPKACEQLHGNILTMQTTMAQESLYMAMVKSDLHVMMLRQCLKTITKQCYISPTLVHTIFNLMQTTSDLRVIMLGESCLKKLICLHPPCMLRMREYYITVLHTPGSVMKSESDNRCLMELNFWETTLREVEVHVEQGLNPYQLKEKEKVITERKIMRPRRFQDSPSPKKRWRRRSCVLNENELPANISSNCQMDSASKVAEEIESLSDYARAGRLSAEAALDALSYEQKTNHLFARLSILLGIMECDLVTWLVKHHNVVDRICDRLLCPLVVVALWKPGRDTGFDSPSCRRIFSLYASSWNIGLHPQHIRTLARLIGLIAEVIYASEPNPTKMYPNYGIRCETMARKISDALKAESLAARRHEAVAMLKPSWLRMMVTSYLLNVSPSESLDANIWSAVKHGEKSVLYSSLVESTLNTYHVKRALHLLHLASQGSDLQVDPVVHRDRSGCTQYLVNYKFVLHQMLAYRRLKKHLQDGKYDKSQVEAISHLF